MMDNDLSAAARASEPALVNQAPTGLGRSGFDQAQLPIPRESYEGTGGWRDGRFGQAYDLVWAALKGRGDEPFRHPLLTQIELLDQEEPSA